MFSLNKEGLGYTPKNGKASFATHKTHFMKGNGQFCTRCKQVGHVEQTCKNKKNITNVSSICFDSCYMLTKGTNGVKAKFIGAPIVGPKKKAICVPKSLVTNLGGPKQVWVPKNRIDLFLQVNYKAGGRHWVLDSGCTQHMTGDSSVAPSFKDKTRYTLYVSPGSQISHIATNKGNIKRQYL